MMLLDQEGTTVITRLAHNWEYSKLPHSQGSNPWDFWGVQLRDSSVPRFPLKIRIHISKTNRNMNQKVFALELKMAFIYANENKL